MFRFLPMAFLLLILSSCNQKQSTDENSTVENGTENQVHNNYSEDFKKHFEENGSILKGDSVLFPNDADADVPYALIPTLISKNKKTTFQNDQGEKITITQVNYTDIEFTIQSKTQKYTGKATLLHNFYFDVKFADFSDGKYIIFPYYVTESTNPCLDYIGLGNQNIQKDKSEQVYACIRLLGDTCKNELMEMAEQKLKISSTK